MLRTLLFNYHCFFYIPTQNTTINFDDFMLKMNVLGRETQNPSLAFELWEILTCQFDYTAHTKQNNTCQFNVQRILRSKHTDSQRWRSLYSIPLHVLPSVETDNARAAASRVLWCKEKLINKTINHKL